MPAWAIDLPASLVKVNASNNAKCVEYMTYKGSLYCSTKAINNHSVPNEIIHFETQDIAFDDRVWTIAWGSKTDQITTMEYVPQGQDIKNWQELITSQFIPGLPEVTAKRMAQNFINQLKQSGFKPEISLIDDQPDQFIFEFRLQAPSNMQQDELQKITKTPAGIYILHYVIKKPDMGEAQRQAWIDRLKKSSIKSQ
jgi:hypothetical protein